jgi:hypothetical protein
MQCHHDIKNPLVAQPFLGMAMGLALGCLALAVMT